MFNFRKKRICVALSGGVDSSVAAYLLKKQGHDVFGVFVRGYNVDGCQDKEAYDARHVAQILGIPFYVLDLEDEYYKRIVQYMLDGYAKGITPNPDVACNSEIKFGLLYEAAMKLGADAVASGHYARVERVHRTWNIEHGTEKNYCLREGNDGNKDQSYFLWQIPYERFSKILFPIGKLKKSRVRMIAKKAGLFTATKKDSQGVCFLGKFSFVDFLKQHIPYGQGDVVDMQGVIIGKHDGVLLYTVGQRHGFNNNAGHEMFVVKRNLEENKLIVAPEGDRALFCEKFYATQLNFLDADFKKQLEDGKEIKILARVRYRQPLFRARVSMKDRKLTIIPNVKNQYKLFPAQGQSVVFYTKKGVVLGGAIISG